MKQWKYIKGSEKDFEGAPDWATCACQGPHMVVYYENVIGTGRWQNKGSSGTGFDGTGGYPIIAQRELIKQWNGEGLPPVGTECEYRFSNVNYNVDFSMGTVIAYGRREVFMLHNSSGNEFIRPINDIEFRPVQNEREKAISEMKKSVTNYNNTSVIHAIEQLYDAGYRKVSAAPGFEWRYVCKCCGCRVEPGEELPHGC